MTLTASHVRISNDPPVAGPCSDERQQRDVVRLSCTLHRLPVKRLFKGKHQRHDNDTLLARSVLLSWRSCVQAEESSRDFAQAVPCAEVIDDFTSLNRLEDFNQRRYRCRAVYYTTSLPIQSIALQRQLNSHLRSTRLATESVNVAKWRAILGSEK